MNVMMYFIYGGTLDFPDKANVGYVLIFNDFKYKSINIFDFCFVDLCFKMSVKWKLYFYCPFCQILCAFGSTVSKNSVTVFRSKNVLATHSNKIKKSLY